MEATKEKLNKKSIKRQSLFRILFKHTEAEDEKKEQRMDLYDDIRGWTRIQFLTPTGRA